MHRNAIIPFQDWIKDHSLLRQIGDTPLIELSSVLEQPTRVRVFGKAEWMNASGSVKDRPALAMIRGAMESGELSREQTILDATSGNTGIAYATIGAALDFDVTLCLPENCTDERKAILRALGANLIFTDPEEEMDGAIRRAKTMAREDPDRFFYPNQYDNELNWKAHYSSTGPEIWRQTDGNVTHFVAGIGTSGTFVGTSRRLKRFSERIQTISFQPDKALHGLEGLKHLDSSRVPEIYDPLTADKDISIRSENAFEMMKNLACNHGFFLSPCGGAAVLAAKQVAKDLNDGTVVTILPDKGNKYMEEWTQRNNQAI